MSTPESAGYDAGQELAKALRDWPLAAWRDEANRQGGLPKNHPGVPAEYVYMANRLCNLIDAVSATVLSSRVSAPRQFDHVAFCPTCTYPDVDCRCPLSPGNGDTP